MSKLELIRGYYDYNEYANNRVLDAASNLSEDELSRKQGASFESVEGNLAHIAAAQIAWHTRWTKGGNSRSTVQIGDVHGFDSVRGLFDRSHADLREFVASLTEQRLDGLLPYTDSRGDHYERLLWQLMLHVANHGSYHRAETAMALTAFGRSPGDLDYVFFEIAREAGHVR